MNAIQRLLLTNICIFCLCSQVYAVPIISSEQLINATRAQQWKKVKEWKLYQEGRAALQSNRHSEAIKAFELSLEANPIFFPAQLGLADVAFQQNDQDAARSYLEQAMAASPDSAVVNTAWAKYLYLSGQHKQAEQTFLKAIELNSEFLEPKLELASLYLIRLNMPEKAHDLYREIITLKQDYAPAHYGLVSSLIALKKPQDAKDAIANAQKQLPEDSQLYDLLGTIHAMSQSPDAAIKAFEQSLELTPGKFSTLRNLSDLYLQTGQHSRLTKMLEAAPADLLENIELGYKMALAYHLDGAHYLAKRTYERILDQQPDMLPALNNLATLLLEDSELFTPARALELAKKAHRLAPDNANYLDTLGWAYFKNGSTEQARIHLNKALQLDPSLKAAREHLKQIDS